MNKKHYKPTESEMEYTASIMAEKIKRGIFDDVDDPKLNRELMKLGYPPVYRTIVLTMIDKYM